VTLTASLQKCLLNDVGFCKYKETCFKRQFTEICTDFKCERRCFERHPKERKRGPNFKFFKHNSFAYDHDSYAHKKAVEGFGGKTKEEVKKQLEM
jgi:hypothetical protein